MNGRITTRGLRQALASILSFAIATVWFIGVSAPSAMAADVPFVCSPTFYQTEVASSKSQFFSFNVLTNTFTASGSAQNFSINGIGYNPSDNLIYGVVGTTLYKIDANATFTSLGSITGASGTDSGGDFYNGQLLWAPNSGNAWYSVNITSRAATSFALTSAAIGQATSQTWGAFDATVIGDYAYGLNNTTLYIVDLLNKKVGGITITGPTTGSYGAAYADSSGDAFFYNNTDRKMYEVTAAMLTKARTSGGGAVSAILVGGAATTGITSSPNDGASCSQAASPYAPSATTNAATSVGTTSVTLNGVVNNNRDSTGTTGIDFRYGTDPTLATYSTVAATPSSLAALSQTDTSVTASLTGLASGTTYYFQVAATSGGGSASGNILNFTTVSTTVPLTVYPDAKSVSYGSAAPNYTFVLKNGSGTVVDPATLTGYAAPVCGSSYMTTTNVSASPLTIGCSGGGATGYTFTTTPRASLTITPATLTVTPDARGVNFGDAVPAYSKTITGFVNGDTADNSSGFVAPTCTSAYSTTTSVAASPLSITCSGGTATGNYQFSYGTAALTIGTVTLSVTPDGHALTYGDSVPAYGKTITGFVNGDTADNLSGFVAPTCTSAYSTTTSVAASPLSISCSGGTATGNYQFSYGTAALTIAKASLAVTPDAQHVTYGDAAPSYSFGVTGFKNSDSVANASGYAAPTCTSTYSGTTSVSSSPVSISCSGGSAANYTFDTTATASLTIGKATLTVTPDAQHVTYGDAAPGYSFGVTGFKNSDSVATASGYVAPTCTSTYSGTTSVSSSPVSIGCSAGSAANYTFDTTATANVTISKAPLTVTPAAQHVTYGDAAPPFAFGVTGFKNGESATNASGYVAPTCTSSYSTTTNVSASPVSIACTGGSAANYTFDTTATASLTIARATLSVSPTDQQIEYGSLVPLASFYAASVNGFVNGDSAANLTGYIAPVCTSAYATSTGVALSPLTITCSGGTATSNYVFSYGAANLTVSKSLLTVTPDAQHLTYGDSAPAYTFTVSGFKNSDSAANASGYEAPTCTASYSASTHAAASPVSISCSGGAADNYYFDTTATANLTIAKAMLTVTPSDHQVAYGDPVPAYTFDVTGFVNHESAKTAAGYTTPTCNSSYQTDTPASMSPLAISCAGGSAADYEFAYGTAVLTIHAVTLTVTPDVQHVTYGDGTPTYTSTITGFVNGDNATNVAGFISPTCTSAYSAVTPVAASPLTITCSGGTPTGRYAFDTSATANLTISKATLTVTPDAQQVTYGDAAPTYTFDVTGFVNEEAANTSSDYTAPVCTSAYTVGTHVTASPLTIVCAPGAAANYRFDVTANAHLTVSKRSLTVTPHNIQLVYGAPIPTYPFDVAGFVNTDDATTALGYSAPVCTSSYTSETSASATPLTIHCTSGTATDYTFDTTATAQLSIATSTLYVVPDSQVRTYGDAAPAYTFTVRDSHGAAVDTASLTDYVAPVCGSTYGNATSVAASPLAITCTGGASSDFAFDTEATATLTIRKATLTVRPQALSVQVGDAKPAYPFDVVGFRNEEDASSAADYVAPTCTSTYTTGTPIDASPLSITCGGGSAANYTFDTSATAPLTIAAIPVGTLDGTAFVDLNGNGVLDKGEPLLANVPVTATFTSSIADARHAFAPSAKQYTTTTDAKGHYSFTLPVGNYTVSATLTTNTVIPSGAWSAAAHAVANSTTSVDFKAVGQSRLNGGVQMSDGTAVPNAVVTCTWAGPDGIFGTPDDAALKTTADSQAIFALQGIPGGTYRCIGKQPSTGKLSSVAHVSVKSGPHAQTHATLTIPKLPHTGANATPYMAWALLLLTFGAALLAIPRRRRDETRP